MKIARFTRGPKAAVDNLNKLVDPFNAGVVINENPDFSSERQPDGRVRIRLTDAGRAKLALPPPIEVDCTPGNGLPIDLASHSVQVDFSISGLCGSASGNATIVFADTLPPTGSWYSWTTAEGPDWTTDDVGDFCAINTYSQLTLQSLDGASYTVEISGVQYGTIGGNTGWFVITWAFVSEFWWCGSGPNYEADYTLHYLGPTLSGTITRTFGSYTATWVISYL